MVEHKEAEMAAQGAVQLLIQSDANRRALRHRLGMEADLTLTHRFTALLDELDRAEERAATISPP